MKKPIAIILVVVLLLSIGAGVFWGTSWHRAIRSAGYRDPVVMSYGRAGYSGDEKACVVRATKDGQVNFLYLREKAGLWRVDTEGQVNPDNGVAHLSVEFPIPSNSKISSMNAEHRLYVHGENANARIIKFEESEIPDGVVMRIDQEFEVYDLQFVCFHSFTSSQSSPLYNVEDVLKSKDLL